MAWDRRSGTRRNLPKDWPARVKRCKAAAGGRCEKIMPSGRRCPRQGSEADHYGAPDDHDSLRWLCEAHHKEHTQKQAQAARRKASGKPAPKPPRPHPGRLR